MPDFDLNAVPSATGIGLRTPHYRELLARLPRVGFLEVHSENYFGDGGQPLYFLEQARAHYALSLHGVGLSLGTTDALSREHLKKLKRLVDRFDPFLVSDHLSWGSVGGRFANDLLPLPYTEEALALVCRHIDEAQAFLRREILVENVSAYLAYRHSTISEGEFLAQVAARTGCGILLDVNNVYVSAMNQGFDPASVLEAPLSRVAEIHLAGFDRQDDCLIDTHGTRVADAVWALYRAALERFGPVPTLIEWDTDIPPLDVLLDEAAKADSCREQLHAVAA